MSSHRVREEWRARIAAEYTSAAITQNLVLWLIQAGAPPDLIEAGLVIVGDELVHSRMSHEVYVAAGGTQPPAIEREQLGLDRRSELLELDILRVAVRVFCLGETVAVPLFSHLREDCTEPVARAALDRILVDEVRHRDFGWALLTWLLDTQAAPALRRQLTRELPGLFGVVHSSYAAVAPDCEMDPADRAWGLMPAALYRSAVERTFERDYLPRFTRLQIDPTPAWQLSRALHQSTIPDQTSAS